MLFKLFFIGSLIYLLYRVSINPSLKAPKEKEDTIVIKKKNKKVSEDDYIDYEEVD